MPNEIIEEFYYDQTPKAVVPAAVVKEPEPEEPNEDPTPPVVPSENPDPVEDPPKVVEPPKEKEEIIPPPEPEKSAEDKQKDLDFARRFTALTKKERDILAKEERLKSENQQYSSWKAKEELAKTDPLKLMDQYGWDLNKLAELALNDNKPTANLEIQELRAQVQEMKKEREEEKQAKQTRETQTNVDNYKKDLTEKIKSKSEQFELVNHFGEYDTVYKIMNDHYMQNDGEILDLDEAAQRVEKYLEDQLEKAAKTKKFTSRYGQKPPEIQEKKGGELGATESLAPSTLTNSNASGSSSKASTGYLDEEASKAKAAKIIDEASTLR